MNYYSIKKKQYEVHGSNLVGLGISNKYKSKIHILNKT